MQNRLIIGAGSIDGVGEESGQVRVGEAGLCQWRVEERGLEVPAVSQGKWVGPCEGIVLRRKRRRRRLPGYREMEVGDEVGGDEEEDEGDGALEESGKLMLLLALHEGDTQGGILVTGL